MEASTFMGRKVKTYQDCEEYNEYLEHIFPHDGVLQIEFELIDKAMREYYPFIYFKGYYFRTAFFMSNYKTVVPHLFKLMKYSCMQAQMKCYGFCIE